MPKYKDSDPVINDSDKYSNLFERREVKYIKQYKTKIFDKDEQSQVETLRHVWTKGDKFYKLSNQYYGNIECWWIIAFFNSKPTEAHLNYGDIIYIPVPLDAAKELFGES